MFQLRTDEYLYMPVKPRKAATANAEEENITEDRIDDTVMEVDNLILFVISKAAGDKTVRQNI